MRYLKQSTSVDLPIGPFLDQTDGFTAETALTLTQPDIRLKKNGGAWAQKAAAQTLSHEENGWYEVTLDATDTDTLGQLMLAVHESGALPVWCEFMVMPANVWDSMFGADLLQVDAREHLGTAYATPTVAGVPEVDITHLGGVAQSLTDLKDFADDGYDPATNKVQGVVLTDTVTTYTGNTPQTGDAFARLGAPAGASVSADVAAVKTDTGNLITRIPAALFSGITSFAQWLGLIAGKQTGDATARTELRATGAGSGTYDETTDSLEAINDIKLPALVSGRMPSDAQAISGDSVAADRLETMLDGTGGNTLSLAQLNIVNGAGAAGLIVQGGGFNEPAAKIISAGSGQSNGLQLSAAGSGHGMRTTGGDTGHGILAQGGSTSGDGINAVAQTSGDGIDASGASNGVGIRATGQGSGSGLKGEGGATGAGIEGVGGATSGVGLRARSQGGNSDGSLINGNGAGAGLRVLGGATGHGLEAAGGATSGDGIHANATTEGDGMELIGAGAGVDLNSDLPWTAAWDAEVQSEVTDALNVYDPPTRAEATADKDEILTQLPAAPPKNTAFTYVIKMVDATDGITPETGLTITMTRSIDGSAFGAATGTVTEISTGHYRVAASAADMNGDVVTHRFVATGAMDLTMEFKTVS